MCSFILQNSSQLFKWKFPLRPPSCCSSTIRKGACQKPDMNNYKLQSHPSILWTVSKSSPATMPSLWFWLLLAGWGWAVKSWQHSVNTFWMRTWQKLFRANFLKLKITQKSSLRKKIQPTFPQKEHKECLWQEGTASYFSLFHYSTVVWPSYLLRPLVSWEKRLLQVSYDCKASKSKHFKKNYNSNFTASGNVHVSDHSGVLVLKTMSPF